jgi:hypothetical protein
MAGEDDQTMIWIPSSAILSAIVASLSLPLFLFIVAHSPWRPTSPMRHFLSAAGLACGLMGALLLANQAPEWPDLLAALVLLTASLLAGYTLWTLIVWGFTLAMLNVLERHPRIDSIDGWCTAYAGDGGIDAFTLNRCSLLLAADFARLEAPRELSLTPRGRLTARFVIVVRWIFGLDRL